MALEAQRLVSEGSWPARATCAQQHWAMKHAWAVDVGVRLHKLMELSREAAPWLQCMALARRDHRQKENPAKLGGAGGQVMVNKGK